MNEMTGAEKVLKMSVACCAAVSGHTFLLFKGICFILSAVSV